jgi:hypothetical protein
LLTLANGEALVCPVNGSEDDEIMIAYERKSEKKQRKKIERRIVCMRYSFVVESVVSPDSILSASLHHLIQ